MKIIPTIVVIVIIVVVNVVIIIVIVVLVLIINSVIFSVFVFIFVVIFLLVDRLFVAQRARRINIITAMINIAISVVVIVIRRNRFLRFSSFDGDLLRRITPALSQVQVTRFRLFLVLVFPGRVGRFLVMRMGKRILKVLIGRKIGINWTVIVDEIGIVVVVWRIIVEKSSVCVW